MQLPGVARDLLRLRSMASGIGTGFVTCLLMPVRKPRAPRMSRLDGFYIVLLLLACVCLVLMVCGWGWVDGLVCLAWLVRVGRCLPNDLYGLLERTDLT